MRGGPGTADPGTIIYTNVTLASILLRAYDLKPYQLAGPDWISSARFDVTAKIPAGATKEQFQSMLQGLVSERFHVVLHRETRPVRGYELVRGKGQLKLRPSQEAGPDLEPTEAPKVDRNGFPQLSAPGMVILEGLRGTAVVSFLTARSQPVSVLAERLSKEFRLPVLDKTGLAGRFDFTLEFAPQAPGALPPEGVEDSASNLVSAVSQQLGLKLEAHNIAVDILVIDKADKVPAENL